MDVLTIFLFILLIGIVWALVRKYIGLPPIVDQALIVLFILVLVLFVLQLFGIQVGQHIKFWK